MKQTGVYLCPVCKAKHNFPYGLILFLVATCSRKCDDVWEKMSFEEKQKIIDLTD